jgi:hypothetical protein
MSHQIEVECRREALPSVSAWNAALRSAGFDLVFDDFDWSGVSGFQSAALCGRSSGVEIEIEDEDGQCRVCFILGASWYELTVASCASVVLAQLTSGVVGYEGEPEELESASANARNVYVQSRLYIARLGSGPAGLPWDQPALGPFEDRESRLRNCAAAEDLKRVDGSPDGNPVFAIRTVRLQNHLNALA